MHQTPNKSRGGHKQRGTLQYGLLFIVVSVVFILFIFFLRTLPHDKSEKGFRLPSVSQIISYEPDLPPIIEQKVNNIHIDNKYHPLEVQAEDEEELKKPVRIAYIFAGSVRSFLHPKVYWSIRFNLIDAFGGEAYTFIRITTEDNQNTKTGDGIIVQSQYNLAELNATLQVLNPRTVEYFRLSTQLQEMQENFPGIKHDAYRANDLRRYSMFYHRCMAYRLATAYAEKHDITFDWVVLVRLDTAWLDPVFPISYYSRDRLWLADNGYVPYNDQFMLIPAQYANYLYDFDHKCQSAIYCLGGPDVEKHKCNVTHWQLTKHNKSSSSVPWNETAYDEQMNATLSLCCPDVFADNRQGFSEIIHYRHIEAGKIPLSMTRFPFYIVRDMPKQIAIGGAYADCPRLNYHFKDYAFEVLQRKLPSWLTMSKMDNRMLPVSESDTTRCAYVNSPLADYQPIRAYDYHSLMQPSSSQHSSSQVSSQLSSHSSQQLNSSQSVATKLLYPQIDYSRSLYDQWHFLHPSLQYNPYRYAAWNIHPANNVEGCLAVHLGPPIKNISLYWSEECRLLVNRKGNRRHDSSQVFLMNLYPHTPYILQDMRYLSLEDEVMSFSSPKQLVETMPNVTRIVFQNRHKATHDLFQGVYCLTVNDQDFVSRSQQQQQANKKKKAGKGQLSQGQGQGQGAAGVEKQIYSSDYNLCHTRFPVDLQLCEEAGIDPAIMHSQPNQPFTPTRLNQWFYTVQGKTAGTHPLSTMGMIRSYKYPELCLVRWHEKERNHTRYVGSNQLVLADCEARGGVTYNRLYFEFEYVHG